MKTYSIDVKIYGTLYIEADTAPEAMALAVATRDEFINLPFEPEVLENVKLAEAMTCHGPDEDCSLELVSEDDAEDAA